MPAFAASVNPFRSECVERLRYRLDDTGWNALLDRLAALDHRAALVGPCGSGKTTLLEELRDRFAARGVPTAHLRLGIERPATFGAEFARFLADAPGRLLFLDGAEQLNWWQWRRFKRASRAAAGLVITTHRAGRLPTLRRCETSPGLLGELVAELEAGQSGSRRHPLALFDDRQESAPANVGGHGGTGEDERRKCFDLWHRHGGNVRNALRELYDRWPARADARISRLC
jgi:hypothetical protein